jgi:hypothetical protein
MRLIVAQQLIRILNGIHVDKLGSICLSTSLIAGVWLGVDTSEEAWLDLENVLTSGDDHIIIGLFWTNDDSVFVVKMRVTHNENLRVGIVLNQFEVVSSLPVILLLKDINVLEVLLGQLDNSCTVLHMEGCVSHENVVQNFDLLELSVQIFGEFNFTATVAVQTESEVFLQPSESLWLPLHVNIEPVVSLIQVWHLNVSVTVLTSDFGIDQSAAHQAVRGVFFHQVENTVGIFVSGSSWKQS